MGFPPPHLKKKKMKQDPRNWRLVSLILALDEVLKHITKQLVYEHLIKRIQLDVCQTMPSYCDIFYDRISNLVDLENAMNLAYLDFSKAFDKVSYIIFVNKMVKCGFEN